MKLLPIINQLAVELPLYTDKFSTTSTAFSLTTSGVQAIVVTPSPHNLESGDFVVLSGAVDLVTVDSIDILDNIATARTSIDHGLSMAMNFKDLTPNVTVEIQGANESIFNGEFELLSVPNRFAFTYPIQASDQSASGSIQSFQYASSRFFGAKQILKIDAISFEFGIEAAYDGLIAGTIEIHSDLRISGAATLDRADASYTKFNDNQYWLFVIAGTTTSSKDRNILNDAISGQSQNSEYRIRLIDNFDIVAFVPTDNEISARKAFDNLEDVKVNIFQSLLGFNTPQQYNSAEQFQLSFVNSEIASYNTAYIVGSMTFQGIQDVTYGDTIRRRSFFPARDFNDYNMFIKVPGQAQDTDAADSLIFDINLDDDQDF